MRIELQRVGAPKPALSRSKGLSFATWNTPMTRVLPVRRASAHVQRNIAGRSRFTGKERDTESGNDYFGARYYASAIGRMMRLDQMNVSATRHYDDLRAP